VLYFFFLGLFQSLVAAVLLARRAKHRPADLFLLLLAICFAVHFLASFLLYQYVDNAYFRRGFMNFTLLTYGPLLLMYARKNKAELETASTRWWLLAPVLIWAIPYFLILGLWLAGSFVDVIYLQIYNRSLVVVMAPLNVVCFVAAMRISRTFPAEQIAIKKLIRIISITGIASVLFCLSLCFYVIFKDIPFGLFQEVVRSIGSVAVLSICLMIARYAVIGGERPRVLAFPSSPAKPRPAQMTKERQKEIYDKLVDKVSQDRLYLDPDFNMEKLTAATGYSRHQISEVLNQYADMSFYPFVNRFRVEQVCAQMKKAAAKDSMSSLNMLELSYACGFKSKSSFNEYFRRFTGETPSQYLGNLHMKEKKF
jgi:AraC-like DNA-binding protein